MFATAMMMKGSGHPGAAGDVDAAAYIAAVEAADGAALEPGVASAITALVTGLKADGLWSQIDQACIMAGARTLAGALVPLRGAAPANNGFVAANYNRKLGLKGNGSRYLQAGMPAYTQNDAHLAVYLGEAHSIAGGYEAFAGNSIGAGDFGSSQLLIARSAHYPRVVHSRTSSLPGGDLAAGLFGGSRTGSTHISNICNGTVSDWAMPSAPVLAQPFSVFGRGNGGAPAFPTTARLAWFSHGKGVALAALAGRLDALMAACAAAIP